MAGTNRDGILHPRTSEQAYTLERFGATAELADLIKRFWTVRWDLRGQEPHAAETLPFPCANIVVSSTHVDVFGISSGKFTTMLEGKGQVFGVKFTPGGLYPFMQQPMNGLTDRSLPFGALFSGHDGALQRMLNAGDSAGLIGKMEKLFLAHKPPPDSTVTLVNQIVDRIAEDRAMIRVNAVADAFGMSERTLQRLFRQYVGVSPKWTIRCYRLHQAASEAASNDAVDWSALALELGYFDQAHLIRDFKATVGSSPGQYARQT